MSLLVDAMRSKISLADWFFTFLCALEIFFLLVAARRRDAVDLADCRHTALESQKAGRDEEIDAPCQKPAQLFVVGLQEKLGGEFQLHLLPVEVGHGRDARERVVPVGRPIPVSGREAEHLVAHAGAERAGLAEVLTLSRRAPRPSPCR